MRDVVVSHRYVAGQLFVTRRCVRVCQCCSWPHFQTSLRDKVSCGGRHFADSCPALPVPLQFHCVIPRFVYILTGFRSEVWVIGYAGVSRIPAFLVSSIYFCLPPVDVWASGL